MKQDFSREFILGQLNFSADWHKKLYITTSKLNKPNSQNYVTLS